MKAYVWMAKEPVHHGIYYTYQAMQGIRICKILQRWCRVGTSMHVATGAKKEWSDGSIETG